MKRAEIKSQHLATINPNNESRQALTIITSEQIAKIADEVRNGARYSHAMGRLGFNTIEARQLRQQIEALDREVTKAESEAYSKASQAVFHRDPLKWLLQGPGRESEAFVGERRELNLQTQEPLRVAHAHLHQNVPDQKETGLPDFSKMTDEELDSIIADNPE